MLSVVRLIPMHNALDRYLAQGSLGKGEAPSHSHEAGRHSASLDALDVITHEERDAGWDHAIQGLQSGANPCQTGPADGRLRAGAAVTNIIKYGCHLLLG